MNEIGSKCCIVCVFLNKFIFIYYGSDPHDFLVNKQKGKVPETSQTILFVPEDLKKQANYGGKWGSLFKVFLFQQPTKHPNRFY